MIESSKRKPRLAGRGLLQTRLMTGAKAVSLNCGNSVLPTDETPHEISRGSG
jgi:hypothetical protein